MGFVSFSIPQDLVMKFQQKGNIQNFVETGTYKGGTTFWASQFFPTVYTIEIDPEMSRSTAANPKAAGKNIKFLIGNSKDVLKDVAKELKGRSLFWLDGHWCTGMDTSKNFECPLMEELEIIEHLKDAVILIDDARAYLGPLPPPHNPADWPRIDEIFAVLRKQYPEHLVTVADDVILAVPPDLKDIFEADWQQNYHKRYGERGPVRKLVTKIFDL